LCPLKKKKEIYTRKEEVYKEILSLFLVDYKFNFPSPLLIFFKWI
jgi:hypothetical protein